MTKPSDSEDEFFAREEAAKLYRATLEKQRKMAVEEREALKAAHFMRCPKCGMELQSIGFRGVTIDRCFNCHGTWLDENELEMLTGHHGPGLLERIAAVFKRDQSG